LKRRGKRGLRVEEDRKPRPGSGVQKYRFGNREKLPGGDAEKVSEGTFATGGGAHRERPTLSLTRDL